MMSHFSSLLFVLHWLQASGGLLDFTIHFSRHQIRKSVRVSCILIGSLRASSPGHSKSQGGKRKESLKLHLWNLNICIEKVNAKICWLAEMRLVMTSLPLAHVSQCLFTFVLISTSRWLVEIWQPSWQGATRELDWWNSNSRGVVESSPSFSCPTDRASWRACSQAIPLVTFLASIYRVWAHQGCEDCCKSTMAKLIYIWSPPWWDKDNQNRFVRGLVQEVLS